MQYLLQFLNVLLHFAFRTLYPKRLTKSTFIRRKRNNICLYSKDVHRTKCQAQRIARLIQSLYPKKIARIRCYKMLSTIFECKDVQHTISLYIKYQDVHHTIQKVHKRCVRGMAMPMSR
jgi:hypothetical protein